MVATAAGQTSENQIHRLNIEMGVTTIGSDPDNDIVVKGPGVLPFHMMVDTRQKPYRVVALNPEADIRVEGVRLTSDTGLEISDLEQVQFGGYALRIHDTDDAGQIESIIFVHAPSVTQTITAGAPAGAGLPGSTAAQSAEQEVFFGGRVDNIILVDLQPVSQVIDVEQTAIYQLSITNAGPLVATFDITLNGVDEEWVEIKPASVDLFEGDQAAVTIRISPPRQPESRAGSYELQFTITSDNYPENKGFIVGELIINPYQHFSLGVPDPRIQRVSWRKRYGQVNVPLINQGNSQFSYLVSAQDDENGCQFEFPFEDHNLVKQTEIQVGPGERFDIPLEISPIRRPLVRLRGREYRYTVSAQALELSSGVQTVPGTFISRALFGIWSILLFIVMLLVAAYLILQPRIYNFSLDKKVIRQGETAQLSWSVSPFTTDLRIDGVTEPISGRTGSLEVLPDQTVESYVFYASNWLFRILRQGEINSQQETVVVIPPSPEIETFFVDKTEIFEGDEITVKWTANDADLANLTVEGVRENLSEENLSGERVFAPKKDTMVILEAENTSGKSTRSGFVSVQKPSIEIERFTLSASEIIEGEPVTITWKVGGVGVESVDIDPVDEELPLEGEYAIFPTESMKVILKVQNRDLKETRLLAVGVLPPGTPPEPPTINYFKASPEELVGGGSVEFSWGVSGVTTNIEITNIDGVVETGLPAQGFQAINVRDTTSYVLTAYNGEVSTSAIVDVTVEPTKRDVQVEILSVVPETVLRGDSVVVYVSVLPLVDGEPVDPIEAGLPEVSGDIVVTDGFDTCTITLPTTSCELTLNRSGEKILTATYGGDDNYVRRTSDPYILPITVVGLQVNFVSVQWTPTDTIVVGEYVSLTFGLTPTDPNSVAPITGRVKLFDGLEEVCLATIYPVDPNSDNPDAEGVCANVSFDEAEPKSLDLAYEGNDIYDGKTIKAPNLTVSRSDTLTEIVSALPSVSIAGEPISVTFQVRAVDPGRGIPSGSVTVEQTGGVSGVNECTGTLDADGLGTCSIPLARVNMGDEEMVATYSGDSRFDVSTSPPFPHTVNGAPTSIAITEFVPADITVGDQVTVKFIVTVDPPGTGTPTGSVTITLPDMSTCSDSSINVDGTGQCEIIASQSGNIPFQADYSGDSQYQASSTTRTVFVDKADVEVSIVSSVPNPSAVNNAVTVNINADLVPAAAEKPVGTVNVTASTGESCSFTYNHPTTTSCQITFNTFGTRTLTAEFVANANYNGDTSPTHSHNVLAQSYTDITSITPTIPEIGQDVTVSYSVNGLAGTPTGSVLITNTLDTETCGGSLASGSGSCIINFETAGSGFVWANYSGDSSYVPSSDSQSITVEKATTAVVISDYQATSTFGGSATFTVTMTTPNWPGANLSGLQVAIEDINAPTANCTATLNTSGVGACSIAFESAGAKTVRAEYAGSAVFKADTSPTVSHTVNKSPTTTTITSDSPDPSQVGEPITVTVRVDGTGSEDPTGGTINITSSPSSTSCTATLSGANTASCQITYTTAQNETITASFVGNSDFLASSDTETHTVGKSTTTTTITGDTPDPSVVGQAVTISVRVDGSGSVDPTSGTINVTSSPSSKSCTATLSGANIASCQITYTAVQNETITASFVANSNFLGSSDTEAHTVNKANTTTTITGDTPDPSVVGQSVTVSFSVVVASPGSGTPTGSVTVTGVLSGKPNQACTATLSSGTGSCSLTFPAAGTWSISASYAGSSLFNSSTSSAVSHTVNKAATTLAIGDISQSPNQKDLTVPVTVTVNLPGSGTPTGTVQVSAQLTTTAITSCNASLSGGVGSCNLTYPGNGQWPDSTTVTINASYPGNADYLGDTATTSFTTAFILNPTSGVAYASFPPSGKDIILLAIAIAFATTAFGLPKGRTDHLSRSKDRHNPG
jgi:hypothetical protein